MNKHSFLFLHRMVFNISCTLTSHVINIDLVTLHTWGTKRVVQTAKSEGLK